MTFTRKFGLHYAWVVLAAACGRTRGSTLYVIAQMHAEVESAKPHGPMQKLLAYYKVKR
jgi:hypothetical protein